MKLRFSKYDREWSRIARQQNNKCEYCGRSGEQWVLNAHHYMRRGIKATRLFLPNAVILCFQHHTANHQFSAHRTPEAFKRWFKSTFPERASRIENKAKQHITERQAIAEFEASVLSKIS